MRHPRLQAALELACLFYAFVGVAVAAIGVSPPLSIWHDAAASAILGAPAFPEDLVRFQTLLTGILGGCIVGKWAAAYLVARWGLRADAPWAWPALVINLAAWFVIDSGVSLAAGAAFNVWWINLAPLFIVGGLLAALKPPRVGLPVAPALGPRLLAATMAALACTGLVFAFWMEGPLMAPWVSAAAALHPAADPADAAALLGFMGGPIGRCVAAHFLTLVAPAAAGDARAPAMVAVSAAAWLSLDASRSALEGAWFNLLLVDLPTVVACALGIWAWRRWH